MGGCVPECPQGTILVSMTLVGRGPSMRNFLTSPLKEEAGLLIPQMLILDTVPFSPVHEAAPSLRMWCGFRGRGRVSHNVGSGCVAHGELCGFLLWAFTVPPIKLGAKDGCLFKYKSSNCGVIFKTLHEFGTFYRVHFPLLSQKHQMMPSHANEKRLITFVCYTLY